MRGDEEDRFCTTRLPRALTPSRSSLRICSRAAREPAGNAMRPPAPVTRCQGSLGESPDSRRTVPTNLALPGKPARRAISP